MGKVNTMRHELNNMTNKKNVVERYKCCWKLIRKINNTIAVNYTLIYHGEVFRSIFVVFALNFFLTHI